MVKPNKAKVKAKSQPLPSDPIEFARSLKRLVSEDFISSYKSIKNAVLKH